MSNVASNVVDARADVDPEGPALARDLDVRPLSGYIGAEIGGVDLRSPLDAATVDAIRATLLKWKVVFFRDQDLTRDQHIAFGRRFGTVEGGHPTLPSVIPEHPEILLLDNQSARMEMDDAAAPRIESRWHTDITFMPNPPMGSILRGVVIPPYGGDTQWTNLAVAYRRLSEPLRSMIDGLHAVHHNALPIERGEMPSSLASTFQRNVLRSVHPVVRVHPETAERVLFVNPNFTSHIQELSRRESGHVLAALYDEIASETNTCRFRWEANSVAFWDNRATAHIVPTDVRPGFHRSMERITIEGDVPVGVDGLPSYALEGA